MSVLLVLSGKYSCEYSQCKIRTTFQKTEILHSIMYEASSSAAAARGPAVAPIGPLILSGVI